MVLMFNTRRTVRPHCRYRPHRWYRFIVVVADIIHIADIVDGRKMASCFAG
jgi:hypothetical protein